MVIWGESPFVRAALVVVMSGVVFQACSQQVADDNLPGDSRPAIATIDSLIEDDVGDDRFAGVALVARSGQVLHVGAYGLASRELGVAHTKESVFLTGSITKLVTALTVLKVAEAGAIGLHDPVSEFFPGVPLADAEDITVNHLLTYRSGLPGIMSDAMELTTFALSQGDAYTAANFLRYVFAQPREGAPGERRAYGNLGYDVLQLIVEAVEKRSFAHAMRARVLGPLGMLNAGMNAREIVIPMRVPGYDPIEGRVINARQSDGGSLYATAGDLNRLITGIFESDYLRGIDVKSLESYGLAREQIELARGGSAEIFWFNGIDMGYSCDIAYHLPTRTSIVLASNIGGTFLERLRVAIANIVLTRRSE